MDNDPAKGLRPQLKRSTSGPSHGCSRSTATGVIAARLEGAFGINARHPGAAGGAPVRLRLGRRSGPSRSPSHRHRPSPSPGAAAAPTTALKIPTVAPAQAVRAGGLPARGHNRPPAPSDDGGVLDQAAQRPDADPLPDRPGSPHRRPPDHRSQRPRLHHPPASARPPERHFKTGRRSRPRGLTRCSSTSTRTSPGASRTSSCSVRSRSRARTTRRRCRRSSLTW